MPAGYQWLLGALLAANVGILLQMLVRKRHGLAVAFVVGAAVPMGYLIAILWP